MSAIMKTYLLAPYHDLPEEGPLRLGSILLDPLDPVDSLNQRQIVKISPSSVYTSLKRDWRLTIEAPGDGRFGIWARFVNILGLGGTFGANFDTKTLDYYMFHELETTHFTPSQAYIDTAVKKAKVRSYLQGSRYKLPIYMVTGLKIVRGAHCQVIRRRSMGLGGYANFGLGGIMTGGLVTLDAGNVSLQQAHIEETSFGGSSPFVFAYRLCKITFQKNLEIPRVEKYSVGALLGVAECNEMDTGDSDYIAIVTVDDKDAVAREFAANDCIEAIDEDDNTSCQIFIIPPGPG